MAQDAAKRKMRQVLEGRAASKTCFMGRAERLTTLQGLYTNATVTPMAAQEPQRSQNIRARMCTLIIGGDLNELRHVLQNVALSTFGTFGGEINSSFGTFASLVCERALDSPQPDRTWFHDGLVLAFLMILFSNR